MKCLCALLLLGRGRSRRTVRGRIQRVEARPKPGSELRRVEGRVTRQPPQGPGVYGFSMAHALASSRYARQASRAAKRALPRLSPRTKRCMELAEEAARALDDNHVGTEHVVLGLFAGAPEIASALSEIGVTRALFEAQLFDEPGNAPTGTIPLTPRSLRILGFAREEADGHGSQDIQPAHVLLGVIDESEYWSSLRSDGPHHFAQAATAVGVTLREVRDTSRALL